MRSRAALVAASGVDAMDNEVISQAEGEEEIVSVDVPDEAIERAASAERQAFTWAYCTSA